MQSYVRSEIRCAWKRDGVRYRRVITRDGKTVIEKGEDGRYVEDYS